MPKVRPLEVKALVPLLQADWESPEELSEALIARLDEERASRTSYVAVLRIGGAAGKAINVGMGPFPGAQSAKNALKAHPALGMASAAVVVPILSPQGYERQMRALDLPKGCK